MRRLLMTSTLALAALVSVGLLMSVPGSAQQPARPGQPPPVAPIKPYKPVAVTLPKPLGDASFDAFRKQLADIAKRKDRAALAKLVAAQGFFWLQDKDVADKKKSGMDNFAKAIDLDAKDGSGWEVLGSYAADSTGRPMPDHQGVTCAPSAPTFDAAAFDALLKSTQTDPGDWGYIIKDGVEARGAAQPTAPVVEKLGLILVRVLPDDAPPANNAAPTAIKVATPAGKSAFVAVDAIVPLANDEICYLKDAGGWKITGYIGGADQ
jgi:hypothetical protein